MLFSNTDAWAPDFWDCHELIEVRAIFWSGVWGHGPLPPLDPPVVCIYSGLNRFIFYAACVYSAGWYRPFGCSLAQLSHAASSLADWPRPVTWTNAPGLMCADSCKVPDYVSSRAIGGRTSCLMLCEIEMLLYSIPCIYAIPCCWCNVTPENRGRPMRHSQNYGTCLLHVDYCISISLHLIRAIHDYRPYTCRILHLFSEKRRVRMLINSEILHFVYTSLQFL